MSNLLAQAIADAKAVRATALSNAKAALEEHFAPKLQSMLSEKLRAEMGDEAPAPAVAPAPEFNADASQDDSNLLAPAQEEAPIDEPAVVTDPVSPVGEAMEDEANLGDLEDEVHEDTANYPGTSNAGNPTPGYNIAEGEKASGNYKTKTSGHKTDNKGQETVATLSTKGGLSAVKRDAKASSDYTKTTAGHKTEDPQGQGNEISKGGYDNDTSALKENEEIDEVSLDEILKELEGDLNDVGMEEMSSPVEDVMEADEDTMDAVDEEIDLNELLSESDDEDEGDEGKEHKNDDDDKPAFLKENISLKKELSEYRSAVVYLRDRINEVSLLNAKLLYTNKLFKGANLSNEQKLKVIESFDLTKSVREAKLVYATLAESLNSGAKKTVVATAKKPLSQTVKTITEGLASKPVASTKPKVAAVLSEGAEMANRFKKLAGIRK